MRLEKEKAVFLKKTIQAVQTDAKVLLFGSRTDDAKKGGDIDILVLGERKLSLTETIKIQVAFWKRFGEQKLDIVSFMSNEKATFKDLVLKNAVEL